MDLIEILLSMDPLLMQALGALVVLLGIAILIRTVIAPKLRYRRALKRAREIQLRKELQQRARDRDSTSFRALERRIEAQAQKDREDITDSTDPWLQNPKVL